MRVFGCCAIGNSKVANCIVDSYLPLKSYFNGLPHFSFWQETENVNSIRNTIITVVIEMHINRLSIICRLHDCYFPIWFLITKQ